MVNKYYTIELTREELDEISIALRDRIDLLLQRLSNSKTPEAKKVITELLQICITAQKQTTYAGQVKEYTCEEIDIM